MFRKDIQKQGLKKIYLIMLSRFGVMFFEYPLRAFIHTNQHLKRMDHSLLSVGRNFRWNQFFTIPANSVKKKAKIDIPEFNKALAHFL